MEKSHAKNLGAKHNPTSGSKNKKGDSHTKRFMVESKSTKHLSFSVTSDLIRKSKKQAASCGKDSYILAITLGDGTEVVVVDLKIFKELKDQLELI